MCIVTRELCPQYMLPSGLVETLLDDKLGLPDLNSNLFAAGPELFKPWPLKGDLGGCGEKHLSTQSKKWYGCEEMGWSGYRSGVVWLGSFLTEYDYTLSSYYMIETLNLELSPYLMLISNDTWLFYSVNDDIYYIFTFHKYSRNCIKWLIYLSRYLKPLHVYFSTQFHKIVNFVENIKERRDIICRCVGGGGVKSVAFGTLCHETKHLSCNFVLAVATNKVEDIRTVLQHYNQFDDPMEKFRENQAAVLVGFIE